MIEALRFEVGNQAFAKLLRQWMKRKRMTIEELSARTGISIDTVKEMRSPRMRDKQKVFRLKNVIAIAIGLHLPFKDSIHLLRNAGYRLRKYDVIDKIYLKILSQYYDYPVASCNDYLVALGLLPLTNNDNISSYL